MTSLKVMSWNLRKGKGPPGRRAPDLADLAWGIGVRAPDLVLCQEVFRAGGEPPDQSQALAGLLAMHPAYGPNAFYRRGDHGNALLSRHPILSVSNHDLSTNPVERRGVLHVRLAVGGTVLHVLNTHLGLNTIQRRRQVRRIADLIESRVPAGEPLLLAGDFNDWTGRLDRAVLANCGVRSALSNLPRRQQKSWPAVFPVFGVDRIYVRGLEVEGARVLPRGAYFELSDHLPLEALLRVSAVGRIVHS